ncbi:MAG: VWA domain-containing protein [Blastocatellia bacterium]
MKNQNVARLCAILLLVAGFFAATQFPVAAQSGRKPKKESADPKHKTVDPNSDDNPDKSNKALQDNTPVAVGEDGTIKMDTTMVTIPVTVLDQAGKFVPTLKRKDFELYEDDIKQEIEHLRPVEEPFHVVLLLDTSTSTAFRHEDIQEAAYAFVEQLHRDDKVMIASFDSQIEVWCDFTSSRETIRQAVFRLNRGGSTRLYDALDLIINDELSKIQGRKAIVLFSDGVDTSSRYSARRALQLIEEADALVYSIYYDTGYDGQNGPMIDPGGRGTPPIGQPGRTPPIGRPGSRWPFITYQLPGQNRRGGRPPSAATANGKVFMEDVTKRSGARFYEAYSLGNLSRAFTQIAEDLRQQYALSYYPTNAAQDGTYRRVKVRISPTSQHQGLIVRSRDGYRAGSKTKPAEPTRGNRPVLKRRLLPSDTISLKGD